MPIVSSVFPALSCTSFKVSGLTLRSLIHFELVLVQGEEHVLHSSQNQRRTQQKNYRPISLMNIDAKSSIK
jgi:hypothetical protein